MGEGYSGRMLERPAWQAALPLIRRGRADTLIVAKQDRLSRSVRDVCTLVEELFSDEQNWACVTSSSEAAPPPETRLIFVGF